jgi:hypothetical protein
MTFRRCLSRDYTLFTWYRDANNSVVLKEIYYDNEWFGHEGTYEKSAFDHAHHERAFRLDSEDVRSWLESFIKKEGEVGERMSKYTLGDYDYEIPGSGKDSLQWEIEWLKAEWHAEIERSKIYAAGQDKIIGLLDSETQRLKEELDRLKVLCARAADALEDTLPMKQYTSQFKLQYFDLLEELRKAAP